MKKFIGLILVAAIGFCLYQFAFRDTTQPPSDETPSSESSIASATANLEENNSSGQLIIFTADEFRDLFNSLSLPNTTPIVETPTITGDSIADAHIAELASRRGYRLRSVPSSPLQNVDGVTVQQRLLQDWQALQQAAKEAGFTIGIRSGYRSIEEQRALFNQRLSSAQLTATDISSGLYDQAINDILAQVAPPGYSRHHHGYTIDVFDANTAVFAYSQSYQWLKEDNFAHAKEFGFIPSYPEDVSQQGADPEPWEFVWANRDFMVE